MWPGPYIGLWANGVLEALPIECRDDQYQVILSLNVRNRTMVSSRFRRQRHFDEVVASGCYRIDFGRYRHAVLPNHRPDVGPEDDQSEFPPFQILLMPDVLIRCNHHIESPLFRHLRKARRFPVDPAIAFP